MHVPSDHWPLASPPTVLRRIGADLEHYAARERRALSVGFVLRMVLVTQGFQFVLARRISELLEQVPVVGRPLRRVWWWWTCRRFGAELAIGCVIDGGLYVPHPYGIVLGVCRVGGNVTLLQNVTVGSKSGDGPRGATIGTGVYLGAGAAIIGAVTIGDGAAIGANAVVLRDVPPHAVAVGVPAKPMAS